MSLAHIRYTGWRCHHSGNGVGGQSVYLLLVPKVILGGGGRLLEIGPNAAHGAVCRGAVLTVTAAAARGGLREAQVTALLMTGFLAIHTVGIAPAHSWPDRFRMAARPVGCDGRVQFRGDKGFFYKGFVYLGVSIVFLIAVPGRQARLMRGLISVALVPTLTRSFVISTSIAALVLLYALRMRFAAMLGTVIAGVAGAAILATSADSLEGFLGDRAESNAIRIEDLAFVFSNLNPLALLLGNGFGTPIVECLNIENAFLWITGKMGLVGLAFRLTPLLVCAVSFSRIPRSDADFRLACALMFSAVLIYVQSAMNPYLNNPIGMALVMIAIFGLRTLSRSKARSLPVDVRRSVRRDRPSVAPDLSLS